MSTLEESLLEIIFPLIPIAFGFFLGVGFHIFREWLKTRSERKKTAIILGLEIEVILQSANAALKGKKLDVLAFKNKTIEGIKLIDADFPSNVYERIGNNLSLFSEDTVAKITELYRWITYAHHWKKQNQKLTMDIEERALDLSSKQVGNSAKQLIEMQSGMAVHFAEIYIDILVNIIPLAEESRKLLAKISKIDTSEQVNIKLSKKFTYEYPKNK